MVIDPPARRWRAVHPEVVVVGELVLVAAVLGLLLVALLVFAAVVLVRRARRGTPRRGHDGFARAGEERGLPLGEAYERGNARSAWTRTTP